jgi:hypothetical protein
MQTLKMEKSAAEVQFQVTYLDGSPLHFALSFKTTAQVGACSLSLFQSIYPEQFKSLGIASLLAHAKVGL